MPQVDQQGFVIFFRGNTDQDPSVTVVPDVYIVPPGDDLNLTLDLSTVGSGSGQATYPTDVDDAVVWKGNEPPGLQVTRVSDVELTIDESNADPGPNDEEFHFRVCVVFQGAPYCTPDPTVLNLGPQGGAGGPAGRPAGRPAGGPAPKG